MDGGADVCRVLGEPPDAPAESYGPGQCPECGIPMDYVVRVTRDGREQDVTGPMCVFDAEDKRRELQWEDPTRLYRTVDMWAEPPKAQTSET